MRIRKNNWATMISIVAIITVFCVCFACTTLQQVSAADDREIMMNNLSKSATLAKKGKNGLGVEWAAFLLDNGFEPKFVAGLLGNVYYEGDFGLLECLNYSESEAASKGLAYVQHMHGWKYDSGHWDIYGKLSGYGIYVWGNDVYGNRVKLSEVSALVDTLISEGHTSAIFGIGSVQWTYYTYVKELISYYNKYAGYGDYITYEQCKNAEMAYIKALFNGRHAWITGHDTAYDTGWAISYYFEGNKNEAGCNERAKTADAIYNEMIAGTSYDDKTAPVISDIQITNITSNGYRVSCTVTDNVGVVKMQFPTWTVNNDQDDLVWHDAIQSGNRCYYDVSISEHKNERGSYVTHMYAWDAAGNCSSDTLPVVEVPQPDTEPPIISDVQVTGITSEGYRVSCTVTDNTGIAKVQFPTWTENNGQDDLIWHDAIQSGNTYYYDVTISEHNNERGSYVTHLYAWDLDGNYSCEVVNTIVVPLPETIQQKDYRYNIEVVMGGGLEISVTGWAFACDNPQAEKVFYYTIDSGELYRATSNTSYRPDVNEYFSNKVGDMTGFNLVFPASSGKHSVTLFMRVADGSLLYDLGTYEAEVHSVIRTTAKISLFKKAKIISKVITKVPKNTKVIVLGYAGSKKKFAKINYSNKTGYVKKKYLKEVVNPANPVPSDIYAYEIVTLSTDKVAPLDSSNSAGITESKPLYTVNDVLGEIQRTGSLGSGLCTSSAMVTLLRYSIVGSYNGQLNPNQITFGDVRASLGLAASANVDGKWPEGNFTPANTWRYVDENGTTRTLKTSVVASGKQTPESLYNLSQQYGALWVYVNHAYGWHAIVLSHVDRDEAGNYHFWGYDPIDCRDETQSEENLADMFMFKQCKKDVYFFMERIGTIAAVTEAY